MSQESGGPPLIRHVGHSATERASGQLELDVKWRVENQSAAPFYLLLAQPIKMALTEPLILDHSSPGRLPEVSLNQDPGFQIIRMEASGVVERQFTYHLALPAGTGRLSIVGRFGYSYTPPDPSWERGKNWRQVAAWQSLADSDPFVVTLDE